MSTVAVSCPSRTGTPRRFVLLKRDTVYRAFFLFAVIFCAAFWTLLPCSAQSSPPQNTTPPETQDDPPPSLVKHPKPPPPPAPAQSNSTPVPQSGSTAAPPAQTPAPQTDAGQNAAAPAAQPAPQNAAPAQSAAPAASSTTTSPAAASNSSTGAAPSPDAPQSTSPSATAPASTVPVSTSSSPELSAPASAASAPEINTRTSPMPLESRANLVPVRVVVHDSSGHAVENLRKEDFQIKQDGRRSSSPIFRWRLLEAPIARSRAVKLSRADRHDIVFTLGCHGQICRENRTAFQTH